MTAYRWPLLLAACALGVGATAETLEIEIGPSLPEWVTVFPDGNSRTAVVGAPPPPVRPEPSEPSVMATLKREMAGQPVVVVDMGWAVGPEGGVIGRAGQTLLSRLQDICEAYAPPGEERVPFAVRGAWALAPATRQEVDLDLTGLSTLDVAGSAPLLTQLLGRLNAMQARALASPQGLDVGGLPQREQAMVLRALRPPFTIARWKTERSPEGRVMRTGTEVLSTDTPPLSARGLRLRAQLRSTSPELTQKQPGAGEYINRVHSFEAPPPVRPEIHSPEGGSRFHDQAEFTLLREVPNTFKPSDLDGAKVRQPIGVQGAFVVKEVLEQAQKVTGLTLVASVQYRDLPVFVGSAALPAGDVMDAIRLSLTAAWRRVGDSYVLAWDRRGLGLLQAMSAERAVSLRNAISSETQEAREADIWLTLALQTPFAADDPLAWTDAQRKAIFSPRPEQFQGWEWPPMVMFSSWTPAQKQGIRAMVAGQAMSIPDAKTGEYVQRTMTEADFARLTLPQQARLELLVNLPGAGWCAMGDWWQETLDAHRVQSIRDRQRQRAEEAKRKAEEEERRRAEAERLAANPNAANPNAMNPNAVTAPNVRRNDPHVLPPAKRRGVMTPALPAESVAAVARLMAARGFDTLFYPVLTEGYATFTSKAFPPHPALGAADGWADGWAGALRAAKANGLTLVGYVEALAWRRPGATNHWLERFPQYLDLDIAGRPFSESVASMGPRMGSQPVDVLGDMVRPREPEVEKRLTTLMTEYMAQPGSSGLLLDAWSLGTAVRSMSPFGYGSWASIVRLGFSVPDRLVSLKTTGVDPVDLAWDRSEFQPRGLAVSHMPMPEMPAMPDDFGDRPLGYRPFGAFARSAPNRQQDDANYMALAAKVLPKARTDGAPWTTYAVATPTPGYNPNTMPTAPAASTVLLTAPVQNQAKGVSLLLRVPRRDAPGDSRARAWNGGAGYPAIAMCEGHMYYNPSWTARDLVVYDFRGAPDEIMDSLRRVGLPED